MKVLYCCAWWGLDHLGLEGMIKKISEAGYDGIEIGIPSEAKDREHLKSLLYTYGLKVIAHQYQASGDSPVAYKESFKRSVANAAAFQPLFINSHTGKDFWSIEENVSIVMEGEKVAREFGVPLIHETHRGRFLYSAPMAREYFRQLPDLKVNFDLSHWCCVAESLLEDQEEAVREAIKRAEHIHARVGHAQGPQINDPRDPGWQPELNTFFLWWTDIYKKFKAENREYLTITPEFGPMPYTMRKPFTNEPANDFFEINRWMKNKLQKHFNSLERQ